MRRNGVLAPPGEFTPGYDVVGRVDAVGSGVSAEIGTRVAAFLPNTGFGGYAEQVCVPEGRLAPIPDDLDDPTAMAFGLNYITAWQLLTRFAPVTAGDKLLCHGAAGGVGTAVLEICQRLGVQTYGTASKRKHDLVRRRGGIPIDYRSEDFVKRIAELTGDGVDVVIDGLGGAHLRESYETIRPGGTVVALGISGDVSAGWYGVVRGMLCHYLPLKLWPDGKRIKMYLISLSPGTGGTAICDDWVELMRQGAAGELKPVIGATLPFDGVREAHRMLDEAAVMGKIVLTMNASEG
jgi:NADPH2:quinone reductase